MYPETADITRDDSFPVDERTHTALIAFRDANPWSGTIVERIAKFQVLCQQLNTIYNRSTRFEAHNIVLGGAPGSSGSSSYSPYSDTIIIENKLSVVTFLHEYAHALKMDEYHAVWWSYNWFRLIFPVQFERLGRQAHMLVRIPFARPENPQPTEQKPIDVDAHTREI